MSDETPTPTIETTAAATPTPTTTTAAAAATNKIFLAPQSPSPVKSLHSLRTTSTSRALKWALGHTKQLKAILEEDGAEFAFLKDAKEVTVAKPLFAAAITHQRQEYAKDNINHSLNLLRKGKPKTSLTSATAAATTSSTSTPTTATTTSPTLPTRNKTTTHNHDAKDVADMLSKLVDLEDGVDSVMNWSEDEINAFPRDMLERRLSTSEVYVLALREAESEYLNMQMARQSSFNEHKTAEAEASADQSSDSLQDAADYMLDRMKHYRSEQDYHALPVDRASRAASYYSSQPSVSRTSSVASAHEVAVPISPVIAPVAAESSANIEVEFDRLITRNVETSSILRPTYLTQEEIAQVQVALDAVMKFFRRLEAVSHSILHPKGLVYQECLSRAQEAGIIPRIVDPQEYDRTDELGQFLEGPEAVKLLQPEGLEGFVRGAADLTKLLRIKVSDDGDLAMAATIVRDCQQFFADLTSLSQRKAMTEDELLTELNAAF